MKRARDEEKKSHDYKCVKKNVWGWRFGRQSKRVDSRERFEEERKKNRASNGSLERVCWCVLMQTSDINQDPVRKVNGIALNYAASNGFCEAFTYRPFQINISVTWTKTIGLRFTGQLGLDMLMLQKCWFRTVPSPSSFETARTWMLSTTRFVRSSRFTECSWQMVTVKRVV